MKLAYSHLKELVPKLKATPSQVAEVLSLIGYMVDGTETRRRNGKADTVLSVELRQNRPDCQSLIGLAREVAAYYGLPLNLPKIKKLPAGKANLKITIESKAVRAIRAIEISGATNGPSPKWLVEWLGVYDMKSISLLVDLSNAVMLLTGYPSHIIDADKVSGNLRWSDTRKPGVFTTLDGSEIALSGKELLIGDEKQPVALAGIVGGTTAEISHATTHAVIEMAVYDPSVIRRDAKNLNIVTEAGIRLSRRLAIQGLDDAFALLVEMIMKNSGAQAVSKPFVFGKAEKAAAAILFDAAAPSSYAGIAIPEKKGIDILKRLGCAVVKHGKNFKVTPPLFREDLELPEDLTEEVVRLVGFDKIPADQLPALPLTRDLTPATIKLKDWFRDRLRALGYDEVLSQPLVGRETNAAANYMPWQAIDTQNSVNEEYPTLRQSLLVGLLGQLELYLKKGVSEIRIFEIGKIFGQEGKKPAEYDSVAALWKTEKKSLTEFQAVIENLLMSLGFDSVAFEKASNIPAIANPHAVWSVKCRDMELGILAALKPVEGAEYLYAFEVFVEALRLVQKRLSACPAVYELTGKIVSLDANVELSGPVLIAEKKAEIASRIDKKNLWDICVIDEFKLSQGIRYTFRVSYKDLSDQAAKELHTTIFG